jgi:hypothetical protein
LRERHVLDRGKTCQQRTVSDGDEARREALGREHPAKLRPDAGRLAGGDGDDRAGYRSSSRSST